MSGCAGEPAYPGYTRGMSSPRGPAEAALVGREDVLAEVLARLEDGPRALALTGPVGVGKSRLAREVLARLREREPGLTTRFVDVRGAAGLGEVLARLGSAVDARAPRDASPEEWVEAVAAALSVREDLVLVLDNVEAVAGEVEDAVFAWLDAAPELRLLLTTRHWLTRRDLPRFSVPPLAPGAAAALLCTLSEQARGRPLDDDERAAAQQVVERLDHLPLAIELAAARAELLPLGEIAARAAADLDTIAEGPAGAGRSLSAALQQAWEMLDDAHRAALAQASLFAHDFTLDDAQAVMDLPGTEGALDLLHLLARKSLVRFDPGGATTRFSLLESVRAFAQAQLSEEARRAGLARLAAHLAERYAGTHQPERPELDDDLQAAWAAVRDDDPALAARVGLVRLRAGTMFTPASTRTPISEDVLRAADESGDLGLRARAVEARALALLDVGRAADALALLEERLPDVRESEHASQMLVAYGYALIAEQRFPDAERAAAEALAGAPRESPGLVGYATLLASVVAGQQGHWRETLEHAFDAARVLREAGDEGYRRNALANAGRAWVELGEPDRAEAPLTEALDGARRSDERLRLPYFLGNVALLRLEQARYDDALALAEEACAIAEAYAEDSLAALRHGDRGVALALAGRWADARRAFLRATEPSRGRDSARTQAVFGAWRAAVEARIGGDLHADRHLEAALAARRDVRRDDLDAAFDALTFAVRPDDREGAERAARTALDAPSLQARLAGRWLTDVLEGRPSAPRRASAGATLRLLEKGHRFEIGGEEYDVSRRSRLRLTLLALAEALDRAPGTPLETHELFEAGWPGQRIQHEAMRNRVYNAVATLRKLGLGDVLLSLDGGYLLDPGLRVEHA